MNIFYLIFICLTVYFSFRYDGIEEYNSHKQHRLWLMCFYLTCLAGFSYGLGADKFVYMREFEAYPDTFSELRETIWYHAIFKGQMPLWTFVNLTCKVLFNSFYAVQLFESATINISVCYIVSKYTHRYFMFLLVYFLSLQYFNFNTEVMREGFAIAFILIGMHGWMIGKKWLFFIALPISLLFHISAATALLFPFVRMKISFKTLILAFCFSFTIWLISDVIFGKIMLLASGGMGSFTQKILFYSIHASTIFGFLRSAITYLIFPFIIMYSMLQTEDLEDRKKQKEKIVSYMVILSIPASAFAGFTRLYNYVEIFYLVALADYIYNLFNFKKHFIIRIGTLVGTIFLILLQYNIYFKSTNTYFYEFFYPYTCILDENKDIYFREIAHDEAVTVEQTDKNVREIN